MNRFFLSLLALAGAAGLSAAQSHDHSGDTEHTAWYARSSDTARYVGYYVGGGAASRLHGEDRRVQDGTWGWDYHGFCLPSRVMLDWFHGRRYQGGQGAYRTDGPKLIPGH
jgi:hypothetical protein